MKQQTLPDNQKGFASITVALVLILVLALITIGFAQLARREQNSALDKQLAIQAFYSAESGINDAISAIDSGLMTEDATTNPNECVEVPPIVRNLGGGKTGASYTCMLVDLKPDNLGYTLEKNKGRYIIFDTGDGTPPSEITIGWQSTNSGHSDYTHTLGQFKPVDGPSLTDSQKWGNAPAVLQISLTPLNSLNRTDLFKNTFNLYAYPSDAGGNTKAFNPSNQGDVVPGSCVREDEASQQVPDCKITINGLSSHGQKYLLHIINYYDASDLTISGKYPTTDTKVKFKNTQAVIDVTGKAKDVLKRLRVTRCLGDNCKISPDHALESQSICKRIQTAPTNEADAAPTKFNTPSSIPSSLRPHCNLTDE